MISCVCVLSTSIYVYRCEKDSTKEQTVQEDQAKILSQEAGPSNQDVRPILICRIDAFRDTWLPEQCNLKKWRSSLMS